MRLQVYELNTEKEPGRGWAEKSRRHLGVLHVQGRKREIQGENVLESLLGFKTSEQRPILSTTDPQKVFIKAGKGEWIVGTARNQMPVYAIEII